MKNLNNKLFGNLFYRYRSNKYFHGTYRSGNRREYTVISYDKIKIENINYQIVDIFSSAIEDFNYINREIKRLNKDLKDLINTSNLSFIRKL